MAESKQFSPVNSCQMVLSQSLDRGCSASAHILQESQVIWGERRMTTLLPYYKMQEVICLPQEAVSRNAAEEDTEAFILHN